MRTNLGLNNQLINKVAEVSLVLGLVLKLLAADLGDLGLRVVPHAQQLLELELLCFRERQVARRELDHDLVLGRVRLAHVCCVPEAQRLLGCWGLEGLCEFCFGANVSVYQ